jgi:phosphatidylinositol alpha-mannosyltransferase
VNASSPPGADGASQPRPAGGNSAWLVAWDVCRRLPGPVAFLLGRLGGGLMRRTDARRRAALTENLRQVLGPGTGERELRRAVRRTFANYGRYWIEFFRLERLGKDEVLARVTIDGKEYLDDAVAAGRGVVIATAHIGNWDAGAGWLGAAGYRAAVIAEKVEPEALFERFRTERERLGVEVVPLTRGADALAAIMRSVRAGKVIALLADRDLTRNGVPVEFFGRTATIPAGPATLAVRAGAVLFAGVIYQEPRRGHWHIVFRPPLEPPATGDTKAKVAELTQRIAHELEILIKARPEQWFVLSRIWRDPADTRARRPAAPAPAHPGTGAEATAMAEGRLDACVQNLAHELRTLGHEADVLAPARRPVPDEHFISLGGSFPIPYNGSVARIALSPRHAQVVRQSLLEGAYDLVHVHEPLSPSVGLIALIQASAPVVGTFHANLDHSLALRLGSPVLRRGYDKLAARIAVSESARRTWQRYFGKPMLIVPNGAPGEFFDKREPVPAFTDGRPTVLFVGRLEPRKGLLYLVRAFLRLKPAHPALRLVVVGRDDRNARDKAMAMVPPRLRPDLLFVGSVPQDDLASYYASADVFCAPSLGGESFGIVLVEAMASGVPVVCSDIGGYRDLIHDGTEGLLVPPRDPAALAAALGMLLDNPARRAAMGDAGRVSAAQYAWPVVAREIEAVYQEVLDTEASRATPRRHRRGPRRG